MAGPLHRQFCKVETDGSTHEGVSISVPPGRNTATVRKRTDVLEERTRVTGVHALTSSSWRVDFEDGTAWTVTDMKAPCGCGGG